MATEKIRRRRTARERKVNGSRKPYSSPALSRFGRVHDLVKGGGGGDSDFPPFSKSN